MQLPTIKFLLFPPKIHPTLLLHFLFLFLFLFFFLFFFWKNQSMAVMGYYSSTQIMVRESCPIKRPVGRIMVTLKHNSQVSVIKIPAIEITTSFRNKVFEDQAKGIVCYRDDKGEIVCEGYDEGPRLHQELQRKNFHPRDAEIIDRLQQNWFRMVKGEAGIAVGLPEDFNWNGYS